MSSASGRNKMRECAAYLGLALVSFYPVTFYLVEALLWEFDVQPGAFK